MTKFFNFSNDPQEDLFGRMEEELDGYLSFIPIQLKLF